MPRDGNHHWGLHHDSSVPRLCAPSDGNYPRGGGTTIRWQLGGIRPATGFTLGGCTMTHRLFACLRLVTGSTLGDCTTTRLSSEIRMYRLRCSPAEYSLSHLSSKIQTYRRNFLYMQCIMLRFIYYFLFFIIKYYPFYAFILLGEYRGAATPSEYSHQTSTTMLGRRPSTCTSRKRRQDAVPSTSTSQERRHDTIRVLLQQLVARLCAPRDGIDSQGPHNNSSAARLCTPCDGNDPRGLHNNASTCPVL
jgi:hypothetical protein